MLKERWQKIAVVVLPTYVIALWAYALAGFPTQGEICEITAAGKNCDSYNILFASAWKIAKAADHWSALITALATAFIAWFTLTIRQVNESQLAHSHQVERAYMSGGGVRAREIFDLTPEGVPRTRETGEFEFHINNYGKTPGTLYKIGFGFCDEKTIPPVPNYTFRYRHNPIDPGRRSQPIYQHKIPTEHKSPVVYGRFYYSTIFGTCHSSGFIYRILPNVGPESIRPPVAITFKSNPKTARTPACREPAGKMTAHNRRWKVTATPP